MTEQQQVKKNIPPTLIVKQRLLFKRQKIIIKCYDGIITTKFDSERMAKISYDKMKESGQDVELFKTTVREKREGKNAWALFDINLEEIKRAMKMNNAMMHISFELEDENTDKI